MLRKRECFESDVKLILIRRLSICALYYIYLFNTMTVIAQLARCNNYNKPSVPIYNLHPLQTVRIWLNLKRFEF